MTPNRRVTRLLACGWVTAALLITASALLAAAGHHINHPKGGQ